tara:strand:- start:336 stop:536 length:201 start_codon:yes stop_codon:yes gene_type:complete
MTVFHGDYEVEFEIYEMREGKVRGKLLGHMAGITPYDAKVRWMENHEASDEKYNEIYALFPKEETK